MVKLASSSSGAMPMRNNSSERSEQLRRLIGDVGPKIRGHAVLEEAFTKEFMLAWQDLNAIVQVFAKLKHLLPTPDAHSCYCQSLRRDFEAFTQQECATQRECA